MSLFAGGGVVIKHETLNWLTNTSFDVKEAKRLHKIQEAQKVEAAKLEDKEMEEQEEEEEEEEEDDDVVIIKESKKKKRKHKKGKNASKTGEDTELLRDKDWGTTKDKEKIYNIEKQMFDKNDKRQSQALWDLPTLIANRKAAKRARYLEGFSGSDTSSEDSDQDRTPLPTTTATPSDTFVRDVKGDYNNVLYETLYRLDVPSYRRTQHSSCLLGLRAHWKVSRDVLKVKGPGQPFITGQDRTLFKRTLRYYSRHRVLQQKDAALRLTVHAKTEDDPYITQSMNFVPMAREENNSENSSSSGSGSSSNNSTSTMEQVLTERTREYNANLRANPHSVGLWFRFIEFQDESNYSKKTNPAHIIEKKISIFEKAMEANNENEDLMIGYLALCAQHYPPDKLTTLWQTIIDKHMTSETLWKEYVLYHQTQYSQFSVARVSEVYSSALSVLGKQAQQLRLTRDLAALSRVEETMASVFVGFCSLCTQAGFTERATALYQAIIEFNCFRPKQYQLNTSTNDGEDLAAFEIFWESDTPRIGEKGATTWQQFDPTKDVILPPEEKINKTALPVDPTCDSLLKIWLKEEYKRDQEEWLPFRTVNEEEDDDNEENDANYERVILFDDIKSFLCLFTTSKALLRLISSFLHYLGLENRVPWHGEASTNARFSVERVQEMQEFEKILGLNLLFSEDFCKNHSSSSSSSAFTQILDNLWQLDDLHCDGLEEEKKLNFARNLLSLLVCAFPTNIQLKNTFLLIETKCNGIVEGRKLCKKWLKQDSANLRLWHSYAQLEKICGSINECKNVYQKALILSSKLTLQQQHHSPLLFWSFAQLELRHLFSPSSPSSSSSSASLTKEHAIHILISASEPAFVPFDPSNPEIRPTRLIRARKAFHDLLQPPSSSSSSATAATTTVTNLWKVDEESDIQASPFALLSVCFAWMEYLSKGVNAACNVFTTYILPAARGGLVGSSNIDGSGSKKRKWDVRSDEEYGYANGCAQHEWLLTKYVHLVYCHTRLHTCSPRLLRGVLQHALKIFPSNPLFLALFVCSESRSQVTGQLRRFFDDATNPTRGDKKLHHLNREIAPLSPMVWIFAISWEMARSRASGEGAEMKMGRGFSPRIMRLFEKALQGTRARCCVALWRLYMRYFLYCGNFDFAHKVYVRSIQQCPWAKRAWLDGLSWLVDWLDDKQVRDVFLMMQEKELRLRTSYSAIVKSKETEPENQAPPPELGNSPEPPLTNK